MNIAHLLISLRIEVSQLLTRRRTQRLLEVMVQPAPSGRRLIADLVALVDAARAVGRMVLGVEVGEGAREPRREAVLLVKGDGLLDRPVADHVPVREILGDDARARLVLLGDFVAVFVFGGGFGGAASGGEVLEGGGRLDVDFGRTKLGVVEEEGGFGGTVFG